MDYGLTGKRALVLASSRGLGLSVAEALAGEGANVLLCGRSKEKLAAGAAAINEKNRGKAAFTTLDLTDSGSAKALFDAATWWSRKPIHR
jgi:3-oxoacyl-[acyl-carrier protein] reductase